MCALAEFIAKTRLFRFSSYSLLWVAFILLCALYTASILCCCCCCACFFLHSKFANVLLPDQSRFSVYSLAIGLPSETGYATTISISSCWMCTLLNSESSNNSSNCTHTHTHSCQHSTQTHTRHPQHIEIEFGVHFGLAVKTVRQTINRQTVAETKNVNKTVYVKCS